VDRQHLILLTGATGYVGGRLLSALETRGCRVRCVARRPDFLRPRVAESTQVVKADVLDQPSLRAAMEGGHHTIWCIPWAPWGFEEKTAVEPAARSGGPRGRRRIIYLGGLGPGRPVSHPQPTEVSRILRIGRADC
jgi:uncharacterized protein YbjT (DUF2867 family)